MSCLPPRKVKVAVLQLLRELLQSSQELCPRQTGLWMPMLDITRGLGQALVTGQRDSSVLFFSLRIVIQTIHTHTTPWGYV